MKDSLLEEAERYNSKGRVAFQEHRYEKAYQEYTAALECLPDNQGKDARAKYLCNRAACYVKQVEWNVFFLKYYPWTLLVYLFMELKAGGGELLPIHSLK